LSRSTGSSLSPSATATQRGSPSSRRRSCAARHRADGCAAPSGSSSVWSPASARTTG
jgi:hypothetical protein